VIEGDKTIGAIHQNILRVVEEKLSGANLAG
jgi:hypothetical protein